MSLGNIIALKIRSKRQEKQMTQLDLATAVGTTAATISAYEKGVKKPSLENIVNIARVFNVSVDWLCGLSSKSNGSEIESMRDVAEMLIKIDEHSCIRIGDDSSFVYTEPSPSICYSQGTSFNLFEEPQMSGFDFYKCFKDFLNAWFKFRELYEQGTIDDEVYDLWKEKELKKLQTMRWEILHF